MSDTWTKHEGRTVRTEPQRIDQVVPLMETLILRQATLMIPFLATNFSRWRDL